MKSTDILQGLRLKSFIDGNADCCKNRTYETLSLRVENGENLALCKSSKLNSIFAFVLADVLVFFEQFVTNNRDNTMEDKWTEKTASTEIFWIFYKLLENFRDLETSFEGRNQIDPPSVSQIFLLKCNRKKLDCLKLLVVEWWFLAAGFGHY